MDFLNLISVIISVDNCSYIHDSLHHSYSDRNWIIEIDSGYRSLGLVWHSALGVFDCIVSNSKDLLWEYVSFWNIIWSYLVLTVFFWIFKDIYRDFAFAALKYSLQSVALSRQYQYLSTVTFLYDLLNLSKSAVVLE